MRPLWLAAGGVALTCGTVGIVLPLLPTVPFLLLAAFCFSRSSDRLHDWLVSHPRLGPPIHDWHMNGAISPKAKRLASLSIAATFLISVALGLDPKILLIQGVTLSAVAIFIWTRPGGDQ